MKLRLLILTLIALQGSPAASRAQTPPAQPNPQAPTLAMPVPLGIQRGTALELTLTGSPSQRCASSGCWRS